MTLLLSDENACQQDWHCDFPWQHRVFNVRKSLEDDGSVPYPVSVLIACHKDGASLPVKGRCLTSTSFRLWFSAAILSTPARRGVATAGTSAYTCTSRRAVIVFPDARCAGFLTEAARDVTGRSSSAVVGLTSNVTNLYFKNPFFVFVQARRARRHRRAPEGVRASSSIMMPLDPRRRRRLRRLRAFALVLIIMQQAPRAYLRDNPIILHVHRRGCVRVNGRLANVRRTRMDFTRERMNALTDKEFKSRYKVGKRTFMAMVEKLRPELEPDAKQAVCSSGSPVTTELKLSLTLRYLCGACHDHAAAYPSPSCACPRVTSTNVLARVRTSPPALPLTVIPSVFFFRSTLLGRHGHARRGKVHHVPVQG